MSMRKLLAIAILVAVGVGGAAAQSLSFGLGDAALEASLNQIGASAKLDLPGFSAEVSLQWGLTRAEVQAVIAQGFQPAEVYLIAALAKISGKAPAVVIDVYKKNRSKGWGFVARELGIKPGSKEFKALKDGSSSSAAKGKKP